MTAIEGEADVSWMSRNRREWPNPDLPRCRLLRRNWGTIGHQRALLRPARHPVMAAIVFLRIPWAVSRDWPSR